MTTETIEDDWGKTAPASIDGIDITDQTECPACLDREGWTEHPAGYYHCLNCWTVWAGDPDNASLVDYQGPPVEADKNQGPDHE